MRYIVSASIWDEPFKKAFGEDGSIHELTDAEVVAAIRKHGRADISNEEVPTLLFYNGYDW